MHINVFFRRVLVDCPLRLLVNFHGPKTVSISTIKQLASLKQWASLEIVELKAFSSLAWQVMELLQQNSNVWPQFPGQPSNCTSWVSDAFLNKLGLPKLSHLIEFQIGRQHEAVWDNPSLEIGHDNNVYSIYRSPQPLCTRCACQWEDMMQLCSLSYRYLLEPTDATRCFDFAQLTQLSHYVFPLEIHFCIRWFREPVSDASFQNLDILWKHIHPMSWSSLSPAIMVPPWNAVPPPRPSFFFTTLHHVVLYHWW